MSKTFDFVRETLLSHSQVIDNKCQVLVDSIEVLQFLAHLVRLLVELLNFDFSRPNISLELLDLIIKYELELFKLLSFLLKVDNSLIFVLDGGISLTNFTLLTLNLLLEIVGILEELVEFLRELFDTFLLTVSLIFLILEVIVNKREITLGLHTLIDDLGEFLFILVFEDIDFVPSVTLDLFSLLFVLLHHHFNLLFQPIGLISLPVQLDPLILLQLLDDLLVMQTELIESLLELSGVLIFLGLEFIESLKICVHLFSIVLSSSIHFHTMGLLHLVDLVFVHSLHVLLGLQQLFVSVVILNLFVFDFRSKLADLLVLFVKFLLD